MAAISNFYLGVPNVASPHASVFAAARIKERRSTRFARTAARAAGIAGEIMLFIWTTLALAFWVLILAGVFFL